MKYLFPKEERLKRKTLFQSVFVHGKKYRNSFITLYVLQNNAEERKAGFGVSGKVKNICSKHRIKRRLKEAYRLNLNKLKKGFNFVMIAKEGTEKLRFEEMKNILMDLFNRAGLILCFVLLAVFSLERHAYSDTYAYSDTVVIGCAGDIYLGGNVKEYINKYGMDYPFKNVKDILSECDIVVANLEAPFTTAKKTSTKKTHYLKVPPKFAESLKLGGIDVVSLANNHIMDYAKDGLLDTLRCLDNENIGYCGAGLTIEQASRPYIKEIKGIKCCFLSFGAIFPTKFYANRKRPGIAPADEAFLIKTIVDAKKEADLIVVLFHWGKELEINPDYYQVHLAHTAIESGANLVLGHHPHVVQGVEYYLNGAIAYSLGNFVFGSLSAKAKNSIILQATFKKAENGVSLSQLKAIPISVENKKILFQPKVLKGEEAVNALQTLSESVKSRGTNLKIEADRGILESMPIKEKLLAIRQNYLKEINYKPVNNSGTRVTVTKSRGRYYIVKRGDTLSGIAKKNKIKLSYLKKLNNLSSSLIYPKQVLLVNPPTRIAIKAEPMPVTNVETEEIDETTMAVIEAAMEYLGLRYRFGGNGKNAIDCSALIQKAYRSSNIVLPRTAKGQFEVGEVVKELKPGDLLFFATRATYATHVGMYLGNNEFIQASRDNGVCVTNISNPYYASRFIGAKRVLNNHTNTKLSQPATENSGIEQVINN